MKAMGKKIAISAVVLVAAMAARAPVSGLVKKVLPWDCGFLFELVAMIAGLFLLEEVADLLVLRWNPKSKRTKTIRTLLDSASSYILVIVGLMWGLSILGVDVQALLAGAGVVALIIGFGAESLIADVITGTFMLFEHQYEVGDIIVVGEFRGTVTKIGIRTTSIMDSGGNIQIVNNSDIRNLINRSNDNSFAVCDIAIPYLGYLKTAEDVLKVRLPQLKKEDPELFQKEPAYSGVQQLDYANDATILRVVAEVAEADLYTAQRKLNRELLVAFEEAGIPNPVMELKVEKKG